MKSSTESLELADIIFYALASCPAIYCFVMHGKHGIAGWLYVIAMCGLRLVGNGMAYHALSTTGTPNTAASIIVGIGLSPLLLAAIGILHESNASIQSTLPAHLEFAGTLIPHLVLGGGIGLAAASSKKPTLLKVGMIIFAMGWLIVAGLVFLSFKVKAHKRRLPGEYKLLLALAIAMPVVGLRVIYAIATAFIYGYSSAAGMPVQVVFGTLPEFLVMITYISAGIVTRNLARNRLQGSQIADNTAYTSVSDQNGTTYYAAMTPAHDTAQSSV